MSTTTEQEPKQVQTAGTYLQAINSGLDDALASDDSVFLLGEDIGDAEGGGTFRATVGLSTRFGTDRVRTTPISEQAIIGAAIGAAMGGMRPVAEIMLMNFTAVAMDQIVNHAAKLRYMSGGQAWAPLTIRTVTGAGYSLGAQHCDQLEAWFAHTAGLKVVAPATPYDAKGLLLSAIFDDDPCIVIENMPLCGSPAVSAWPEPGESVPLGKAHVEREGDDVTIISYGKPVLDALAVAERLQADGPSVEVVNLRTVKPWDERTVLESVAKTGRAVVLHEAVRSFGVGAEISARINEELFGQLKAPVQRVASQDTPVPFSRPLEQAFLYSTDTIERAVRSVTG